LFNVQNIFTVHFTEEERESARKTALQLSENKKTPYTTKGGNGLTKGITVLSTGIIHTSSAMFNSSTTIFPVGFRSTITHHGKYSKRR